MCTFDWMRKGTVEYILTGCREKNLKLLGEKP